MANKLLSENKEQMKGGSAELSLPRDHNKPPALVELFTDDLKTRYAEMFAKVGPIRERANARAQSIESDADLAAWGTIYTDAKVLHKVLDQNRIAEARPFASVIKETFDPQLAPLERIMEWVKAKADDYNRAKAKKQREEEAAERARLAEIERKAREDAAIAAEFGKVDEVVEQADVVAETQRQITAAEPVKVADLARVVDADTGRAKASAGAVWKFRIDDYSKVDLNAIRHLIQAAAIDKAIGQIVKLQKGATKIDGVVVYEDVSTKFHT